MAGQERISRLLRILMNKSVLDPKAREEIEEILGESGQISSIGGLIDAFVEEAPYFSPGQRDALRTDLREIFKELDAEDGTNSPSDKIKAIKEKIRQRKFDFDLNDVPSDVSELKKKDLEDLVKLVIDDIFGTLIGNLSPDDRLHKEVQIERVTERAVEGYLK